MIFPCNTQQNVLELPPQRYSGGMVDAGDLKSPAHQQAYGFESRL